MTCDNTFLTWLVVGLVVLHLIVLAVMLHAIRILNRPMQFLALVETAPEDPKEPWQT